MKSDTKEPRVKVVVSPEGIERVEIWGLDRNDQETAFGLYCRLASVLRQLDQTARHSA